MRILGIDPGATTGYVVYDTDAKRVVAYGEFEGHDAVAVWCAPEIEIVTVERLVPHGASYPQVVEASYTAGRLVQKFASNARELKRTEVRRILQDATHGAIKVRDDKTVWAALVEIHGGAAATEKGGPLHGVKSHARAALAVAVAWWLTKGQVRQ